MKKRLTNIVVTLVFLLLLWQIDAVVFYYNKFTFPASTVAKAYNEKLPFNYFSHTDEKSRIYIEKLNVNLTPKVETFLIGEHVEISDNYFIKKSCKKGRDKFNLDFIICKGSDGKLELTWTDQVHEVITLSNTTVQLDNIIYGTIFLQ